MIVNSAVYDITATPPVQSDVFLVDTNVWFWTCYSNQTGYPDQLAAYPPFLKKAMIAGSTILCCGLVLSELAHLIEKVEREIYERTNQALRPSYWQRTTGWMKPKDYRHNHPNERAKVVSEISAVWGSVETIATLLEANVDAACVKAALERLRREALDGYDLFFLESLAKHPDAKVLTDDGDYCNVAGIEVFTANRKALELAAAQTKLATR